MDLTRLGERYDAGGMASAIRRCAAKEGFRSVWPLLDERGASASWAASEALALAYAAWRVSQGVRAVSERRWRKGIGKSEARPGWSRDAFGGEVRDRKRLYNQGSPSGWQRWIAWSEPGTPAIRVALRWVCKSPRRPGVGKLRRRHHPNQPTSRWLQLLHDQAYSLQGHPEDRGG